MSTEFIPLKVALLEKQTILKVTLQKTSILEKGNVTSKTEEEYEQAPHEDLVNAMNALAPHWAALLGFDSDDPTIKITGYTISSGKKKGQSIILTGYRETPRGRSMIVNTPQETMHPQDEGKRYADMDALLELISAVKKEALAYILEGKTKIGVKQGELPGMEKVTKMVIAAPENTALQGVYEPADYLKEVQKATNIKHADPNAMARVVAMDKEEKTAPAGKVANKGQDSGKRVAQSAANKSGIVE